MPTTDRVGASAQREVAMDDPRGGRLVIGGGLVTLGILLLARRLVPGLDLGLDPGRIWPLFFVVLGGLVLLSGLANRTPATAVPASVLTGLGLILFWQNATGRWESWAYLWSLMPGFVGIGLILSALFGAEDRAEAMRSGATLLVVSAVLFIVFGSLLGGLGLVGPWWPALLIALGGLLLARSFLGART
jgi:hypothetical protein